VGKVLFCQNFTQSKREAHVHKKTLGKSPKIPLSETPKQLTFNLPNEGVARHHHSSEELWQFLTTLTNLQKNARNQEDSLSKLLLVLQSRRMTSKIFFTEVKSTCGAIQWVWND
jgi:hypothetical protein